MINSCFLLKRLSSTVRIGCFTYPLSAMALFESEFVPDDNPWKVSAFVSAIVELFLSILLLLGAAIAFITSRFVKFFGLEPPCTYIGCSHPLHFESFKGQVYPVTASCKLNNLCTCEFCPDCHPQRIYSKLHSNGVSNEDKGSNNDGGQATDVLGSRDHNTTGNDVSCHFAIGRNSHEMYLSCGHQCSCRNSRLYGKQNQSEFQKRNMFAHAASSSKLNEDDLPLLSARSISEGSGGFDAEDQCDVYKDFADSEEEGAWKETSMKDDDVVDDDSSFAYNCEAQRREILLEDANKTIHGVCGHLLRGNQADGAELSSLCTLEDEFEKRKVSMNNTHELVSYEANLVVLENQVPSHCNKGKGDKSNIGTLVSHPSSNSVNLQKAETISIPLKVPAVGEFFNKKGRMAEACNEEHYNTSLAAYIEEECSNRNNLDQGAQLPEGQCATEFESNSVGICTNRNDADSPVDDTYINNGKVDDRGLANLGIHLGCNSQGMCSNETASEKNHSLCSRELMSENVLSQRAEDEHTMYDDDCLGKDLTSASLASLALSSQLAIGEGDKACFEGADLSSDKEDRHLDGEELCRISLASFKFKQGELLMKVPGRGGEGEVLDDAIPTKESPASLDAGTKSSVQSFALAQSEKSSEHVEGMALSVLPLEADEEEEEIFSEEEQEGGFDALKSALLAERSSLVALEAELENERNAAAVATSEAMAMISRLQEEKSAMQMEVAQLHRMSEEKADYDEQAMALLKEILFKRETENMVLEKEVELYRERLLAEKCDGPKGNWFKEETGSPSPQSLKRLFLTGEHEEFLPPSVASAKFNQSGTRSALWMPQSGGTNKDLEEPNAFSHDLNANKRSRDSPMSVGGFSKLWDDEGGLSNCWDGGLHGPHNSCEQLTEMGRCVFSTDDEETQSILERLWVLEGELQELPEKDNLGSQKLSSKAHEVQQLADSPTNRRDNRSLTDVWGGQSECGIKSKGQGEAAELDGVAGGFVPIHDVYEVRSASNRSPPCTEERDSLEGLDGMSRNSELLPRSMSENFIPARMARHIIQIPPRTLQTRRSFFSDEIPNTPTCTRQAAGWIVGKSSNPESPCELNNLQLQQSLISREERRMELEEIQQLAVRLKALEDDRELLRQTLESFKHRDSELSLLQEIAQHLRELRMAGFTRVSGGAFPEEASVTSPSKSRALKKRRYCSGPGQAQMLMLQHKSI
eukprot:c17449_g1_i1 orf=527-4153(-)